MCKGKHAGGPSFPRVALSLKSKSVVIQQIMPYKRSKVTPEVEVAYSYFFSASSRSACSQWESGSPPPSAS
jgi:hypothetical protein